MNGSNAGPGQGMVEEWNDGTRRDETEKGVGKAEEIPVNPVDPVYFSLRFSAGSARGRSSFFGAAWPPLAQSALTGMKNSKPNHLFSFIPDDNVFISKLAVSSMAGLLEINIDDVSLRVIGGPKEFLWRQFKDGD